MQSPSQRSLSSAPDPRILEKLCAARNSGDVVAIQQRHEAEAIHETWPHVPYVQRCALLFARAFEGDIFHDLDSSDFGEPDAL